MRDEDAVALTIRLPAVMRDEFARAMREAGTTVSERLRDVIAETLRGRVPGPPRLNPAEWARQILRNEGKLGSGALVPDDQQESFPLAPTERGYRDAIVYFARIVLIQDAALRRVQDAIKSLGTEDGW